MKLKKVAAICKKRGVIRLYDRETDGGFVRQYVGDNSAIYPLTGLPRLEEDSVFTIFDLTEKEAEKITFFHDDLVPVDVQDAAPGEMAAEPMGFTLTIGDRDLIPLHAAGTICFIDDVYLGPVRSSHEKMEYHMRRTASGQPYIAAKAGMILLAAIMPISDLPMEQIDQLERAAVMSREAAEVKGLEGRLLVD